MNQTRGSQRVPLKNRPVTLPPRTPDSVRCMPGHHRPEAGESSKAQGSSPNEMQPCHGRLPRVDCPKKKMDSLFAKNKVPQSLKPTTKVIALIETHFRAPNPQMANQLRQESDLRQTAADWSKRFAERHSSLSPAQTARFPAHLTGALERKMLAPYMPQTSQTQSFAYSASHTHGWFGVKEGFPIKRQAIQTTNGYQLPGSLRKTAISRKQS